MFSIESKGQVGNNEKYGILRNTEPLDYETARSHEISVRATVRYLSLIMRKTDFCICENKGADQRLCFSYTDSPMPLLLKSEV